MHHGSLSSFAAIAAAIAAIFAIDMSTPLGLAVPFLYLLAMLFAIGLRVGLPALVAIAALCTGLAFFKLLHPPADGVAWLGHSNRLIFTILIWASVGLEYLRIRFRERLESLVEERTLALHRANAELHKEVAERQQAEATVQAYAERLRGLAGQLVEAQEVEREKLAAELHDRIGQNLSALNISLSLGLARLPPEAEEVRSRLADGLALIEQTTEMVRGVMEELHPALLDQYGLEVAVRWYGEEFSRRTGLALASQASALFPRLKAKVEIALFRIVQEALTNVAKHAAARRVEVALRRGAAGIELEIVDDGVGIDAGIKARQGVGRGWGLAIMAERARAIGADLSIQARAEGGTRLAVQVPNGSWESDDEHRCTDR